MIQNLHSTSSGPQDTPRVCPLQTLSKARSISFGIRMNSSSSSTSPQVLPQNPLPGAPAGNLKFKWRMSPVRKKGRARKALTRKPHTDARARALPNLSSGGKRVRWVCGKHVFKYYPQSTPHSATLIFKSLLQHTKWRFKLNPAFLALYLLFPIIPSSKGDSCPASPHSERRF